MNFFSSLFVIELRRHWASISTFALMGLVMPIVLASGGQTATDRPYQLFAAFCVLANGIMTPFWLITLDRIRGSILILWRLPVSRESIVGTKLGIAVVLNSVILLSTALLLHSLGAISARHVILALEIGLPANWLISTLAIPIYFLLNVQIGAIVAIFVTGLATSLFVNLFVLIKQSSIVGAVATAYLIAALVAIGIVRVTTNALAQRFDPR